MTLSLSTLLMQADQASLVHEGTAIDIFGESNAVSMAKTPPMSKPTSTSQSRAPLTLMITSSVHRKRKLAKRIDDRKGLAWSML
jgi:hypothetical protein